MDNIRFEYPVAFFAIRRELIAGKQPRKVVFRWIKTGIAMIATKQGKIAVIIKYSLASRLLVKIVDVLGHDASEHAHLFKLHQGKMSGVRSGV